MRKINWVQLIAKEIETKRNTPFVWGDSDCCLTVADIIKAYTGEDLAEEFRGRYTTAIGSARALKRYGQGSISATLDTKLTSIPPSEAGRGDVVVILGEHGESLGILFNTRVWAMTDKGLSDFPTSAIIKAWRV